jgi:membrane-associated phospholipid phosphatase
MKLYNLFLKCKNIQSSFVKKIAANDPHLFKFFIDRISLRKFSGLPLTLFFLSFIANLILLTKIVETFVNSQLMLSIDKSFAHFLYSIRIAAIANSFLYFTKLGSLSVVIILALIAIFIFSYDRKYIYIISLLISLTGTGITVFIGKNYFHRHRPDGFGFYNESSYSFPSGHATIAVAFYGILFYSIIRDAKKYKNKFYWIIASFLFVFLLGFSRLYLGVHYLIDVLAGYSLGLLWLLLAISIIEWKNSTRINNK